MQFKEIEVAVDSMVFRGKQWGDEHLPAVIALHGWLDNCASFDFIAPHIKGVKLLCFDLAGHGRTTPRQHGGPYNFWQDATDLFALCDALGLETFGLIGHSRGAMIATVAAGTFPERVTSLGLIEGLLPPVLTAEEAPKQLALSISEKKIYKERRRTVYSSFEAAVEARQNGLFKLHKEEALALANWGVAEEESGKFSWRYDTEVMMNSSLRLLKEQVAAFINNIQAPTRLALGDSGIYAGQSDVMAWMESFDIDIATFSGGHHLHMCEQNAQISAFFNSLY